MKKKILSILLAAAMLVPSILMTGCGAPATPPEGTYTRMTVDINPSVEFMIDDENKVVSVTALNDDGSILIAGEAFVGKTPEEAAELMVTLAGETGYLVGGSVEAGENEVKISISGDSRGAIYYTTNGAVPNPANSTRYTGPFTVSGSCTVKAVTVVNWNSVRSKVASYCSSDRRPQ